MLEIICMPMIVAIVYAIIELYKKAISTTSHTILIKIIPIIACVLGVVAGTIFYYVCPQLIVANNLATAMLIGGASGLSATGCNQIFKQLKQYGIEVKQNIAMLDSEECNKNDLNSNSQNDNENKNDLKSNTQNNDINNLDK